MEVRRNHDIMFRMTVLVYIKFNFGRGLGFCKVKKVTKSENVFPYDPSACTLSHSIFCRICMFFHFFQVQKYVVPVSIQNNLYKLEPSWQDFDIAHNIDIILRKHSDVY